MKIRVRLVIMNFLEFFVWGSWLTHLGSYLFHTLKFDGSDIGKIFSTMGIASIFMPAILGIVADKWVNAERLLSICHMAGAILLFWAAGTKDPKIMFGIMLLNSMAYMPTIALNNTVSYIILGQNGYNITKAFPPIRVWGTIGFIVAMWVVDFAGWVDSSYQLYLSAAAGIILGCYSFTLPACPPLNNKRKKNIASSLGLDALVLFKNRNMLVFLLFSVFLGAALQITNTFGESFLGDFKTSYTNSFAVQHPALLMSISQISETIFILTISFFLRRFGIKKVMMISIFAWVFRFGLFGIGNPGNGFLLLVLSMIIYGMAFDFFNISGSLFVERESNANIRASAQGLFMLMTNGIGAFLGGLISGWVVDYFTINNIHDWQKIWFSFAGYALLLGIFFPFAFNYKHERINKK